MPSCTCNDTTQTKKVSCAHCSKSWKVEMPYHERVSECPEHCRSIAICGGGCPPLCEQCTAEGYKVKRVGGGFCPKIEVYKE